MVSDTTPSYRVTSPASHACEQSIVQRCTVVQYSHVL
jgi:hypothetical protein